MSTTALPAFVEPLGHGVFAVDTGFHRDRFDAAYLMVHDGRAAFIDTGTNHAVPRLLAALDALGVARDSVDYVIPTHVHLDHAGGAGLLMQHLPAARMLIHPRGERHMIDPSALYQGALAVYGEAEMARSYGTLVGVAAERVTSTADGMVVELAGRPLRFADTPGHAKHHHCIWDATSRGWFTGDTFGLSYREFDTARGAWILPTSTPVQFDPEALRMSVLRMAAMEPECLYLTHYGRVADVPRLATLMLSLLDQMVALSLARRHDAGRHDKLKQDMLGLFHASVTEHGCGFDRDTVARLLAIDIELNAQGVAVWLDKLP
jgi:glyoxylase-like metal-dependent hydrolase (beta-lactamase superfamily II)